MWYRIRLTLNTGLTKEYNATPGTGTNTLFTFTIPSGQEFTGFNFFGTESGC